MRYVCIIRVCTPEPPIASSFSPFSLSLAVRCAVPRRARPRAYTHLHRASDIPTSFLPSFPSTYLSYPPSHSYAAILLVSLPSSFSSLFIYILLYLARSFHCLPFLVYIVFFPPRSSFQGLHVTRTRRRVARANFACCAVSWLPVHIVLTRIYIHAVQSCASMCIESVNATSVYMGREKAGIRSCTTIHSVCRRWLVSIVRSIGRLAG